MCSQEAAGKRSQVTGWKVSLGFSDCLKQNTGVPSRVKVGQGQNTLIPACSWSPTLAQEHLLWSPVESRYAWRKWCGAWRKVQTDREGAC